VGSIARPVGFVVNERGQTRIDVSSVDCIMGAKFEENRAWLKHPKTATHRRFHLN
jgi:hypothetical protein